MNKPRLKRKRPELTTMQAITLYCVIEALMNQFAKDNKRNPPHPNVRAEGG